jgi:hypothetical protein
MKAVALLAVAGLAAVANAQSATVVIDALGLNNGDSVNVGDSVTWQVSIQFTGAQYLLGANLKFTSSLDASIAGPATAGSSVGPGQVFNGGAADGTGDVLDNLTYANAFAAQFGGAGANPFILATFTATANALGGWSISADKRSLGTTAAIQLASGGAFAPPFTQFNFQTAANFSQTSDTINVVPTPGALALLGLGGLAAGRRRR